MTKALLKKQIMEVFSWVYFDRKKGENRSKGGVIIFSLLYFVIFAFLGVIFFGMANLLCKPLSDAGFGWLYFAIMGLVAVALGVFGSVFNTYSTLYTAKDNDFLLSLPIPPRKILAVRLLGVYLTGLMYELIIALPTMIVYFIAVKQSVLSVIFNFLLPIVLSFFVLTLSCALGFLVALIGSKLKNKNIITVVLSLIFIACYYVVYAKANDIIQSIVSAPETVGSKVKSILYPFYHMGLGAEGNALSFVIFTTMVAVLFFITYYVLAKTFLSIATANKGSAKKVYKEKTAKVGSIEKTLLIKEFRRFTSSSVYMLNCGLGIVLMPVVAVLALIKGNFFAEVLTQALGPNSAVIPLIATAVICMLCAMNNITSPSVSLEGKNIYLVQSFPVEAKKVLQAKLKLHVILTVIPAFLLAICICVKFKIPILFSILILSFTFGFISLTALIGLALNLKMPNLTWTDPTVPVKQSLCVVLGLFGGWVIILALCGIYLLLMKFIAPVVYLIGVLAIIAVLCLVLLRWINVKGAKIFESL